MSQRENLPGINNGFGTESPGEEAALEQAFRIVEAGEGTVEMRTARRGEAIAVGLAREIPPGGKTIVSVNGVSIGIFNIEGRFHAVKNLCPHAGAPLCQGHIQTTHRPGPVGEFQPALAGRVLRCPWHGWEFDIVTGKGLYDRHSRVATYAVDVDEEGRLLVRM